MIAERIRLGPQAGPQTAFLASQADIVIYGGEAGGGKSYALQLEAARGHKDPDFGAVIFRRTSPQITAEGGLWDEAGNIYPQLGGQMMDGVKEVRFPSGARIQFRHLQHDGDKYDWQGSQIALIQFDELTHFTASQFWYLISRNRSASDINPFVRATTNPEAGSWVFDLVKWWIDPDTGHADPDKSGRIRWFIKLDDELHWADTPEELTDRFEDSQPKSFTFIHASLADNPALIAKDPGYRANIEAQSRVERERLKGNWFVSESSQIEAEWLKNTFTPTNGGKRIQILKGGDLHDLSMVNCHRFATIDTAGTSKEKAAELKGKPPSYSALGIWDYFSEIDALCLRFVWRQRVGWKDLKIGVNETLKSWNCIKVYIENAHFGPALRDEIRGRTIEMVGPKIQGMRERQPSAKLERATASGLLSRLEHGNFYLPPTDAEPVWVAAYKQELLAWQGLPDETSDQIDISSYGSHVAKRGGGSWGGHLLQKGRQR